MHSIRKTWWLPVVALLALAGLHAAGGHGPEADANDTIPPVGKTTADAESALRRLADGAPPTQAAALADGAVTKQEYRTAVEATLTCLRRRADRGLGIEVSAPKLSLDGFTYTYEYSIAAGPEDATTDIERACRKEHLTQVERGYHLGKLADRNYVASVEAQLGDCLDRAEVPSHVGPVRERVASELSRTNADPEIATAVGGCLRDVPSINDLN